MCIKEKITPQGYWKLIFNTITYTAAGGGDEVSQNAAFSP